jgi:hypothetical protein
MTEVFHRASEAVAFPSIEAAQAFLARNLPIATAGNPRYRSGQPGVALAWITRAIAFGAARESSALSVSMSEDVLEFRNGVRSATGAHEVAFSLGDVEISELRDSGDVTESGEKAVGVIFRCKSGKCIRSVRDGVESSVDWTDISLQDDAMRANVLAAFHALQQSSGDKGAPTAP